MKRRTVVTTQRAAAQLNSIADWIAERAPATAEAWFARFVERLNSLAVNAERCGRARENSRMPFELRELLFGARRQWRVLFTIHGDIVLVLAIRHASQDDVTLDELA